MDLVGTRYIKGHGRFYSPDIMDLYSHLVYIESQRTKKDDQVARSLLRCWKVVGLPDFPQLDNELGFRGSNRYPRSPGLILRLWLHYGVHPVFIPVGEPWRNGEIERFNDTYDKKFFCRQWFSSYAMLKRQSKNFQRFHNRHHRYSCLKGKTPFEVIATEDFRAITIVDRFSQCFAGFKDVAGMFLRMELSKAAADGADNGPIRTDNHLGPHGSGC
jgi:hypothetical protein